MSIKSIEAAENLVADITAWLQSEGLYSEKIAVQTESNRLIGAKGVLIRYRRNIFSYTPCKTRSGDIVVKCYAATESGRTVTKNATTLRQATNFFIKYIIAPLRQQSAKKANELFDEAENNFMISWWAHDNGYRVDWSPQIRGPVALVIDSPFDNRVIFVRGVKYDNVKNTVVTDIQFGSLNVRMPITEAIKLFSPYIFGGKR